MSEGNISIDDTQQVSTTKPRSRWFSMSNWPPGYLILWIVTLISLTMNVLVFRQILLARQIAQKSIADSIAVIESLQGQVIDYTVIVDQDMPIDADIPVQQTIPIHINENFQ